MNHILKFLLEEDDPCWNGYTQYGMKKKNGKEVPNCIKDEAEQYDESVFKKFVDAVRGWSDEDVRREIYDTRIDILLKYVRSVPEKSARRLLQGKGLKYYQMAVTRLEKEGIRI